MNRLREILSVDRFKEREDENNFMSGLEAIPMIEGKFLAGVISGSKIEQLKSDIGAANLYQELRRSVRAVMVTYLAYRPLRTLRCSDTE